jgi:hypothetical protein
MKILLCSLALCVLALFTGNAIADEGPLVVWDRVEGIVAADVVPVAVGPFVASPRWRSTGGGRVMLNLGNGFLSFWVDGVSWANHYTNAPLGSPSALPGVSWLGTVVCDSTERFGAVVYVDTPVLDVSNGATRFEGFVQLPEACALRPSEIVFLVRHGPGPQSGAFLLYGAERTIR